jgi:intein-encoded DNA endonuclease-like protein
LPDDHATVSLESFPVQRRLNTQASSLSVAAQSRAAMTPRASPRRRTVPLALRIELYSRAKALRNAGLTYSEIVESLRTEYKVAPSKGQLSEWLRGIHGPFGSANHFSAEPTPELAYVIGVLRGDGSLNRRGYNRRIRLQSVDLDFVLAFDRCLSKVLGTRRHTPWFDTKRKEIHVEARSVLLHDFLNQAWEYLKPWIEHCDSCRSMFLRGFFDSEGSVSEDGYVTCSNSDFPLLKFVQHLLSLSKVETTGPRLQTRAGTKISNRGRSYTRKLDVYCIYVRTTSLSNFNQAVGFNIRRKHLRLQRRMQREAANRACLAKERGG